MSDAPCLCDCTQGGGEAKEMRGATGTWLTPRHAREAAVLLMAERVGACQQHAAESTMVSHHSAETERQSLIQTHTHKKASICIRGKIYRHTHTHIGYTATLSCQSKVEALS